MNAIVSICHFCELHGPSVVFCTQAFRDLLGFNVIADIETSELQNTKAVQDEEQIKVLKITAGVGNVAIFPVIVKYCHLIELQRLTVHHTHHTLIFPVVPYFHLKT